MSKPLDGLADEVEKLVRQIAPLLAGRPPSVQGAALADLTAIWLAGHLIESDANATRAMRKRILDGHTAKVRELVPINAKIMGHE